MTVFSESVPDSWKVLWAKSEPRHPLWKHMLDASAVSLCLPPLPGDHGLTGEAVALFVGLHDVGKADSVFQHRANELSQELADAGYPRTGDAECRHERISAGFVQGLLKDTMERRAVDAVSLALAAHHGHWDKPCRGVSRPYEEAQWTLCSMLRYVLCPEGVPTLDPPDLSAFGMLLAGRVVLSDWIASNEGFYLDRRFAELEDIDDYFATAKLVAREWVSTLGLSRTARPGGPLRVVDVPRPLQQALLDEAILPGLVIVEAPMGEGKTEAAWILAEKWRSSGYHGMYMALPTMATSDSLYGRYRDSYLHRMGGERDVRLVHGMAWIRDDEEMGGDINAGESEGDRSLAAAWFRPTRRAMLAAHGVGTVDQAMLAGMKVKFGFLRLYGLAGRVLVIDEVHAYDAYMSTIIAGLLRWCASLCIPVVLLSATLSAAQRATMVEAYGGAGGDPGPEAPYPLVTAVQPGGSAQLICADASQTKRLAIQCVPGCLDAPEQTAATAEELVRDGGCCCVVVNTVRQAQRVYEALSLPPDEKLLFHARFTARDRRLLADQVLGLFGKDTSRRPSKHVLVATQVVEQSLDVDFDHMITEVAPIDLLLQRSGRLHRHRDRDERPVLHVLVPAPGSLEFGGTGKVYKEKPLLRTLAILDAIAGSGEVRLPEEFRCLIERCYGSTEWEQDAVPWKTIREADQCWEVETGLLETQARAFVLTEPHTRSFRPVGNDPIGDDSDDGMGWRAKTRLGANDSTALMVRVVEAAALISGDISPGHVRKLYEDTVRLPGYLPIDRPAPGCGAGTRAGGRLRGLLVLPVDDDGSWRGVDERGGCYEVRYDKTLGLVTRRAP